MTIACRIPDPPLGDNAGMQLYPKQQPFPCVRSPLLYAGGAQAPFFGREAPGEYNPCDWARYRMTMFYTE